MSRTAREAPEDTDSVLAARLLENFATPQPASPRCCRATTRRSGKPVDAIEEGLDPDGEEVWSRILEVTGG